MAWASRSDRDRKALNAYVESYSSVLEAWQTVPGLAVSLDRTRVRAAQDRRSRQIEATAHDD